MNTTTFFKMQDGVCFCHNIDGLLAELGIEHKVDEWRLFINASNASLKAVLLHNGNEKPSLPIAHVIGMKQFCESMTPILRLINYAEYDWTICADLKVVAILLGLHKILLFLMPLG